LRNLPVDGILRPAHVRSASADRYSRRGTARQRGREVVVTFLLAGRSVAATAFVMADGSVRTFTSNADPAFLELLAAPPR